MRGTCTRSWPMPRITPARGSRSGGAFGASIELTSPSIYSSPVPVSDDDRRFMRRCLVLARRAEGRTAPNPIVGCVIVGRGGRVLAEGWHRKAGLPHAEADALARLDGRAPGATLYVSLEPCAHTSPTRRTAPCTPLVAAAGVGRVVYGLADPFPGHGGGVAALARAGVRVDGPVLAEECRRANEVFLVYATARRAPFTL